jgi:hypothetical protein
MFGSGPLDKIQHSSRSWRIHQIAKDFRLLDVWALPTRGGPDDFGELVRLMATVHSLRERLPADLADPPSDFDAHLFTPLYVTDDEFALEIANQTVHGVMHVGWVPDGTGGYRGQMAVLVKPNGVFGVAYLAAIAPFRHLVVYPLMMRGIGRAWRQSAAGARP